MVKTSWESSHTWYSKLVGQEGHYFHEHVVIPAAIRLLGLQIGSRLLDLGCGQGVLARQIRQDIDYAGIDVSPSLIKEAKKLDQNRLHSYICGDVTEPLNLNKAVYSHCSLILSLQNMKLFEKVINNISTNLKNDGKAVVIINHPYYRIPRQTGWEVDHGNKQQKRWVNRYLTPMEIPISTHPGEQNSPTTLSYHQPLFAYINCFTTHGMSLVHMEEPVSDKESAGSLRKMENLSRKEIPLFMALVFLKNRN